MLLLLAGMTIPAMGCAVTRLDSDHDANFRHIFGEPPKDLKVIQSLVWCMWWTTDDWEFELEAPASWIEEHKWGLRRIPDHDAWDEGGMFPGKFWRPRHASDWFTPGAPSQYEVWDLRLTSIPYRHLYIEKATRDRPLVHLYYRKD